MRSMWPEFSQRNEESALVIFIPMYPPTYSPYDLYDLVSSTRSKWTPSLYRERNDWCVLNSCFAWLAWYLNASRRTETRKSSCYASINRDAKTNKFDFREDISWRRSAQERWWRMESEFFRLHRSYNVRVNHAFQQKNGRKKQLLQLRTLGKYNTIIGQDYEWIQVDWI